MGAKIMNTVTTEGTQGEWNKLQVPVDAAEAVVIAATVRLEAAQDKGVVNTTEVEEAQKAVYEAKMQYDCIWRRRQEAFIMYTEQLSKEELCEVESCGGLFSPTQDPSNGTDGVPLAQQGFTLEQEGYNLEPAAVNFNRALNIAVNDLVVFKD